MIDFDIRQLVPSFLLQDKNGYAMAKAIEAGLRYFLKRCQVGLDTIQNVDEMPEWRLDELAEELNCLYDFNADITAKRRWISSATPLFYAYGTPQSIYNYLEGYFDEVELEENWQYAGEPYHFRVTVSGEWNAKNEAWLRRAIAEAKNVRSVLDDMAVGSGTAIVVRAEGGVLARFGPPVTSEDLFAGSYPQESITAHTSERAFVIATHDARGHAYPYPQAGTRPETSTIGVLADNEARTGSNGEGAAFAYLLCGDDKLCGTDEM